MSLFICFKHLSRSLQVHHMQWKDRTSPLRGPGYTLDGAVGFSQFTIVTGGSELLIGKKFGPGVIHVKPEYQPRFRARATKTRAELSILAVQRSDERTYRVNVVPTGAGSLVQSADIIVNCK